MTKPLNIVRVAISWIWKHTATGVALVLIVGALSLGYRMGTGNSTPVMGSDSHDHETDQPGSTAEPQMYTCSMHPSVRLPDPNAKCPICRMSLIPVGDTNADVSLTDTQLSMSPAASKLARIETTTVARFSPTAETRLFGKITYDQTSVTRITAYFPGRIERLFINYVGVPVSQGDHVAEVYSPEVLSAFEELRQAKLAVDQLGNSSGIVEQATRDTLIATREKLRLYGLKAAQIQVVEDGSFDSEFLTVFSPRGGVVTHLAIREGDYVQTGDAIATVADLSRLWLDLQAYESQLPALRWGQRVTFTVEARPGRVFEGRISFIEPLIDEHTRTAAVRVAVDNADGSLTPGMFATAVVRTRMTSNGAVLTDDLAGQWVGIMHPTIVKDAPGTCEICGMDLVSAETLGIVGDPSTAETPLVIPRTAVLFTGTRSVVYIEVPDTDRPTYEARNVTLGPRAGEYYIVRDGLRRGESVVSHGAFRIDSAMQIEAKPSMMMPSGGRSGNPHAGHGGMMENQTQTRKDQPQVQEFAKSLRPVFVAYLDAQEALASDDLAGFTRASETLQRVVQSVQEVGLVGKNVGVWRRAAAVLGDADRSTTMELARQHFGRMSSAIILIEKAFGHAGSESLSIAYCPMAFDNEGARWLQRGSKIKNPYFGAMMLGCGEVQETLQPSVDVPAPKEHIHE